MTLLAPTMQAFFTDRLIDQKNASPRTIAAYRDTMRLLLTFADRDDRHAAQSSWISSDLDAPLIGAFLDHLERDRGNSPRTRNARLAAIHSLYRYAALRHPEHAHTIARVIEIPQKTHERATVCYLEPAGDQSTACRAGPEHLARASRSCAAADRDPDRAARLRALRRADRSRPARHRREHPGPRETTQAARHAAHTRHRQSRCASGCANAEATRMTRCSRPGKDAAEPEGDRVAAGQAHQHRRAPMPVAEQEACHPARAQAHQRDARASPRTTSRPSRSGSGTRARNRPRSICTPTPRSNRKRSTRSPRSTPRPAATSPPTSCSRSSTACEPGQLRQGSSSASPSTTGGSVSSRT